MSPQVFGQGHEQFHTDVDIPANGAIASADRIVLIRDDMGIAHQPLHQDNLLEHTVYIPFVEIFCLFRRDSLQLLCFFSVLRYTQYFQGGFFLKVSCRSVNLINSSETPIANQTDGRPFRPYSGKLLVHLIDTDAVKIIHALFCSFLAFICAYIYPESVKFMICDNQLAYCKLV